MDFSQDKAIEVKADRQAKNPAAVIDHDRPEITANPPQVRIDECGDQRIGSQVKSVGQKQPAHVNGKGLKMPPLRVQAMRNQSEHSLIILEKYVGVLNGRKN